MKIVFLGTPEIAKICLEKLFNSHHEILAVVTQPDRPNARGNKLIENPVKSFAKEKGIQVLQFESISKEGVSTLKALKPDALVLVAFGQLLSEEVLSVATPINLHGSILPKYRGASPVQTAILNGDKLTGVSVMKMEKGLDTGPVLLQQEIEISPNDTSLTLFEKMGNVGGDVLVKALDILASGNAKFIPQSTDGVSYTEKFTKAGAHLDFADNAQNIVNKIHAYNPSPVAYFMLGDKRIKVFTAEAVLGDFAGFNAGEVIFADKANGFCIKAGCGAVKILTLQAPNGKVMPAKDFLNGTKIEVKTGVF